MSQTDKGVLIFNEWFEAMEKLCARDYKKLVKAIYSYQVYDQEPPVFEGKAEVLAKVIFPCINRRKRLSKAGKLGARVHAEEREKASGEAARVAEGRLEAKEEKSKEENRTEKNSTAEQRVLVGQADPVGRADAQGGSSLSHPKLARGKYGNVFLSDKEYEEITRVIFNADDYIDRFSEKLHVKGYRFESHFDAIMHWWEWDKRLPQYSSPRGLTSSSAEREQPKAKTAEDDHWDEFFDLAVKRSLG